MSKLDTIRDGYKVSPGGARIKKRWEPKEWRPEYESIVALSCTGLSNVEIGERYGYTKEHISNILNTAAAKKLREIITKNIRDKNTESIAERVAVLQEKAFSRIEKVIESDNVAENSPLAMFRASMEVLKGTGMMRPDGSVHQTTNIAIQQVNNNTLQVGKDFLDDLNKGIELADHIQEIHPKITDPVPDGRIKRIEGKWLKAKSDE